MSKNSELKAKFRRSPEWKNFRKHMAELYDNKDAITGKPLRKKALFIISDFFNKNLEKDVNLLYRYA